MTETTGVINEGLTMGNQINILDKMREIRPGEQGVVFIGLRERQVKTPEEWENALKSLLFEFHRRGGKVIGVLELNIPSGKGEHKKGTFFLIDKTG